MISRPQRHNNGTVTYWSVYQQAWVTTSSVPDAELAAMPEKDRRRVMLHFASHGDDAAQAWLDEQREAKREIDDTAIAMLQDEAARAGDHEQVRLCEVALGVHVDDAGSYPTPRDVREAREACAIAMQAAKDMEPGLAT